MMSLGATEHSRGSAADYSQGSRGRGEPSEDRGGEPTRGLSRARGTPGKQPRRGEAPEDAESRLTPTPGSKPRPHKQARTQAKGIEVLQPDFTVEPPADKPIDQLSEQDIEDELKRLKPELETAVTGARKVAKELADKESIVSKARTQLEWRIVRIAKTDRTKAFEKLAQEAGHLGKYRSVGLVGQHGSWEPGLEAENIEEMRKRLREERANLENLRKSVSKQSRTKAIEEGEGGANNDDADEVWEMREVCNQRTAWLNKEEGALKDREQKLRIERSLHLKERERLEAEQNSNFRHYPVLNERYQLLNLIGKGCSSEVFKAVDLQSMDDVAVKIHELSKDMTETQRVSYIERTIEEHEAQKVLKHPRIVELLDCFVVDKGSMDTVATVLEHCEGDTLDAYMEKQGPVPEKEGRGILIQILSGLRYMNSNGRNVSHHNLRPENLFFHLGELKICDFGQAKSTGTSYREAYTYWYLAPECFEEEGQHPAQQVGSKANVWSAGVIFYELLFSRRPFGHGQSQEMLLRSAMAGASAFEVVFPQASKISNEAKEFLKKLLTIDVHQRPDVHEAFNDPYLRKKP